MKPIRLLLAAAAVVALSTPARGAGIPVIDVSNLAQQVQQVVAWSKQYGQMADQITRQIQMVTQLQNTFDSFNGPRGLQGLVNGPLDQAARRYLPPDMAQIYDLYNGTIVPGYGALTARIQSLRRVLSGLPAGYYPAGSQLEAELNRVLDTLGTQRVLAEESYKVVTARTANTEALIAAIGTSTDPRAIAELQARIAAEQVLAQNEANRIAVMQYEQAMRRAEDDRRISEAIGAAEARGIGSVTFRGVSR